MSPVTTVAVRMLEASSDAWAFDQLRTAGKAAYAPRPTTEAATPTTSATRHRGRLGRSIGRSIVEALLITIGPLSDCHASAILLAARPDSSIFRGARGAVRRTSVRPRGRLSAFVV